MITGNSYPPAIYDPTNLICNLKTNSFCTPNCDYHGEINGNFANSYSITNANANTIPNANVLVPKNTLITYK